MRLGGMVFPDDLWIEAVCEGDQAGDRVDVIPFHAYPETWTPDGVTVENYLGTDSEAGFLTTADEACGRKPIWINETGYATTPGRSEADQARWWLRAVATFAAEPRVEHIGIYEIKDLPLGRDVTSASLADVHRHLFTRADGRRVLFLWSGAGDQMVDVQLGGQADAIEYGLDGSVARRVPRADGWLRGLELRAGAVRVFELGR